MKIVNKNFPSNNSLFSEMQIPTYEISKEIKDMLFGREGIQNYDLTDFLYDNMDAPFIFLDYKEEEYRLKIFTINTNLSNARGDGFFFIIVCNPTQENLDVWHVFQDALEYMYSLGNIS